MQYKKKATTKDEINNQEINQNKFREFQSEIAKLSINDKLQYRVATINFYSGSSIVDNIGLKKIKKISKIAKERNAKIKVVGHASKRTRDMPLAKHKLVNFNISDKRAQSVANVFIKQYNIPSSSLITEAVSDTKPLFKENMPAGTKANQRTEIFLIY
ncbi:MAG: OmpA family protein [Alphaproteobacteria bacterium]